MKLSREIIDSSGPQEISLRAGGSLIRAELQLTWKVDGDTLISSGFLSFKLPFKEKMEFRLDGVDRINTQDGIQLESFSFEDGKQFFGRWKHLENRIFYEDHRKKFEFDLREKPERPIISAGGILFYLLRMRESEADGVYVGSDQIYQTHFANKNGVIQISFFRLGKPEDTKKVANLFVDSQTHFLKGGEIYLPVIGKIGFESKL